jgi:hypothetical protein
MASRKILRQPDEGYVRRSLASPGMNNILKGVRPLDYVLAAVMTAAGIFLMIENIAADPNDSSLAHPLSTQTWAMLPVFPLVTVPILWRRRNILAVLAVTIAATAVHVLAFDWVTRCGVELPLAFALAYAVARFAGGLRNQLIGVAEVLVLLVVTLLRDSSIGPAADGLVIAIPGAALFYGIGLLVQNRVTRKQEAVAVSV